MFSTESLVSNHCYRPGHSLTCQVAEDALSSEEEQAAEAPEHTAAEGTDRTAAEETDPPADDTTLDVTGGRASEARRFEHPHY